MAEREQVLRGQLVAKASGLHLRQSAELAAAQPLFELVHVVRVLMQRFTRGRVAAKLEPITESTEQLELEEPQRASEVRGSGQLREAATITGKNLGVRVAPRREAQQQLVAVKPREQALTGEHIARCFGLDLRQPAELAAPHP